MPPEPTTMPQVANTDAVGLSERGTHADVARPVAPPERIATLDLLRGFAVLGILVMNIQFFSMVDAAYMNPTVSGGLTGINYAVWLFSHVFFDMKFMTLFSMLFGAGILLFCDHLEQRGIRPWGLHLRRSLWLIVFGAIHAYLLWVGDILVWYGMSALLAYPFRRLRPGVLLVWALALLVCGTALYLLFQVSMPSWPDESLAKMRDNWNPSAKSLAEEIAAYRGSWLDQMSHRVPFSFAMQTVLYVILGVWRTLGLMLAGMALLKWGVLSGQRSDRFYATIIAAGLLVGWPLTALGVQWNFTHRWALEWSMFAGHLFNYWGSLFVAMAYVSMWMIVHRHGWLPGVRRRLEAVGRMAFSSYILQTLICTTLFYGHGFGLFERVDRWGQLLIVLPVWIAVILFAEAWGSRFRHGPLEWLWRSLTYGRRQPMTQASAAPA